RRDAGKRAGGQGRRFPGAENCGIGGETVSITELTAVELGKKIQAGEISAVEAVQASLDRIDRAEEQIHAYVTIDREGALKRAVQVQEKIEKGTLSGPL